MTPSVEKVYLVGAGCGAADLLTLRAARAIAQASVLLVDDLVNEAVLQEHASPSATIIHVGKRGGQASTPQAEIERLLLQHALAGERVVRLKGGEPLIFGRAGEEIAALQAAGIPFELINGISAAQAAAADLGLSLTHRQHARGAHPVRLGRPWPSAAPRLVCPAPSSSSRLLLLLRFMDAMKITLSHRGGWWISVCSWFGPPLPFRVHHGRPLGPRSQPRGFQIA